jgi:hypothetical protein
MERQVHPFDLPREILWVIIDTLVESYTPKEGLFIQMVAIKLTHRIFRSIYAPEKDIVWDTAWQIITRRGHHSASKRMFLFEHQLPIGNGICISCDKVVKDGKWCVHSWKAMCTNCILKWGKVS